jgi:hypothetical protein
MIKIESLKYCDRTNTKNSEEWFLSVYHQVDSKEDLQVFLALFTQSINEHFELGFKDIYSDLAQKYVFKKTCVLTFYYKDLSISLFSSSNPVDNLFNFNYN